MDAPAAGSGSRHAGVLARAFPDPQAQALAVAAERGDAAEVRRLMQDEGVDPDTIFGGRDGGMPLLAWPIYAGSPEGLRAMLENGADPNVAKPYPEEEGRSKTNHSNAMVWAAEQEDPVYLELLLDHGGDPNTRNANNEALLFHAFIKQNQWRNVQLLVERGADVNAKVSAGGTIMNTYAARGGFMMVHWLLEHGADPTLEYVYGRAEHLPHSRTIESIYWHPGDLNDPSWQRRCQQWLMAHGHERPPLSDEYRIMRRNLELPHEESQIPLL
ncbi:ankyrin repeat domain-containing protein [Luteimonas sp. Y-2-2-4F]|nr:ankyrin repeat domain-containing protein [Luteimonas sp. Y-2-2-4F]MCD9031243.1 ankyrin repeat domain-containing protein [Luteimonas sp. Y-2-2-4F]